MKIHHIDCGSMCPCGGRIPKFLIPPKLVCHCLLIECQDDLILVDTGLGDQDIKNSKNLGIMSNVLGIDSNGTKSAVEHIKALGFSPEDVTHIIPTHLDFDHAGGILDFPNAKIHVSQKEFRAAFESSSVRNRQRYRKLHHIKNNNWKIFNSFKGEAWFGFEAVRDIDGLPPEILLIPLFGHSEGQVGVAIYNKGKWLLHCGDAYYDRREIIGDEMPSFGLKLLQKLINTDYELAMKNQQRLAKLFYSHPKEIELICAHDVNEFILFKKALVTY